MTYATDRDLYGEGPRSNVVPMVQRAQPGHPAATGKITSHYEVEDPLGPARGVIYAICFGGLATLVIVLGWLLAPPLVEWLAWWLS